MSGPCSPRPTSSRGSGYHLTQLCQVHRGCVPGGRAIALTNHAGFKEGVRYRMTSRSSPRRPLLASLRRWLTIIILTLALAEVSVRVVFSNRQFDEELLYANAPLQR